MSSRLFWPVRVDKNFWRMDRYKGLIDVGDGSRKERLCMGECSVSSMRLRLGNDRYFFDFLDPSVDFVLDIGLNKGGGA